MNILVALAFGSRQGYTNGCQTYWQVRPPDALKLPRLLLGVRLTESDLTPPGEGEAPMPIDCQQHGPIHGEHHDGDRDDFREQIQAAVRPHMVACRTYVSPALTLTAARERRSRQPKGIAMPADRAVAGPHSISSTGCVSVRDVLDLATASTSTMGSSTPSQEPQMVAHVDGLPVRRPSAIHATALHALSSRVSRSAASACAHV